MILFEQFIALLVLFGGAAVADKLLLYRHKQKWHDFAVKYWCRLGDTRIPDIIKTSAAWLIKASDKLLINKRTVIVVYVLISIIFVCIAYAFNAYLEGAKCLIGSEGDIWDAIPIPHIVQIITVIGYDIIALMLMRKMLMRIRDSSATRQLLYLLFHGIYLIALMISCLATIRHEESWLINNKIVGERGAQRTDAINEFAIFFSLASTNKQFDGIMRSNLQEMVRYSITNYKYGFISTNPQVFLERVKNRIGSNVFSHVDNTFYFDIYQSFYAFAILLDGQRAAWVSQKTLHIAIGNDAEYLWKHDELYLIRVTDFLLTSTLIFPAISGVCILTFIFVSRLVILGARRIAMYSFELLADRMPKDVMPFTLLAAAADISLILFKIFFNALHWIYHH